jgi:hypothetical protein
LLIAFAALPVIWLSVPILLEAGLVGSYAFSGNNALLQQRITDDVRGRVMGTYLLTWGLMPLGALWMGQVAELTDIRVATVAGGALSLVAMLVMRFRSRELRYI